MNYKNIIRRHVPIFNKYVQSEVFGTSNLACGCVSFVCGPGTIPVSTKGRRFFVIHNVFLFKRNTNAKMKDPTLVRPGDWGLITLRGVRSDQFP